MSDDRIESITVDGSKLAFYQHQPKPTDVADGECSTRSRAATMARPPALTEAEHRAMRLTAELWNVIAGEIVGNGTPMHGDLTELAQHLHAIQNALLAQAAARAYPEHYRLLGYALPIQCDRCLAGLNGERIDARQIHQQPCEHVASGPR